MRWLGKKRLRFLRGQRGFTLIETILAVAILGVIGVAFMNALDTNAKATRTLDEKVVATNLATAHFEAIKAAPYEIIEPYYDDVVADITIPPQYDVDVDIQFSSDGNPNDGITWVDTYTDETIQKITITVFRDDGRHILSICTFKTKRVEG